MGKGLVSDNRGYTFIELVVAVTILSFLVVPLLGLFTGTFSSIAEAGKKTAAINLARDKMESVKASGYPAVYDYYVAGGNSPRTEHNIASQPEYIRVTEVSAIIPDQELLPPGTELLSIRITVYWDSPETEKFEVLESILGRR